MPNQTKHPNYFKLYFDTYQLAAELPAPQGAKLLFALDRLFFEGIDPGEKELPRDAKRIYFAKRPAVLAYRRSALNGMENDPKTHTENHPNIDPKNDTKNDSESDTVFCEPTSALPADTQSLGTHPDADPAGGAGRDVGQQHNNSVLSNSESPAPASYQTIGDSYESPFQDY